MKVYKLNIFLMMDFRDISGIVLNDNVFSGNTVAVSVRDDTSKSAFATGTLDVTKNYWGSSKGPTYTGNPSGTGDPLNTDVDPDVVSFLFDP